MKGSQLLSVVVSLTLIFLFIGFLFPVSMEALQDSFEIVEEEVLFEFEGTVNVDEFGDFFESVGDWHIYGDVDYDDLDDYWYGHVTIENPTADVVLVDDEYFEFETEETWEYQLDDDTWIEVVFEVGEYDSLNDQFNVSTTGTMYQTSDRYDSRTDGLMRLLSLLFVLVIVVVFAVVILKLVGGRDL